MIFRKEIMAFQFQQQSQLTKIIIVVELFVVSYLLYTLTVSIYKSYQIDQYILNFRKENDRIAEENKQLELDYNYMTSDAFIEKMAKQNLNLKNSGEKVIIIPKEALELTPESDLNSETERIKTSSNPEKWWRFFFDFPEKKP